MCQIQTSIWPQVLFQRTDLFGCWQIAFHAWCHLVLDLTTRHGHTWGLNPPKLYPQTIVIAIPSSRGAYQYCRLLHQKSSSPQFDILLISLFLNHVVLSLKLSRYSPKYGWIDRTSCLDHNVAPPTQVTDFHESKPCQCRHLQTISLWIPYFLQRPLTLLWRDQCQESLQLRLLSFLPNVPLSLLLDT